MILGALFSLLFFRRPRFAVLFAQSMNVLTLIIAMIGSVEIMITHQTIDWRWDFFPSFGVVEITANPTTVPVLLLVCGIGLFVSLDYLYHASQKQVLVSILYCFILQSLVLVCLSGNPVTFVWGWQIGLTCLVMILFMNFYRNQDLAASGISLFLVFLVVSNALLLSSLATPQFPMFQLAAWLAQMVPLSSSKWARRLDVYPRHVLALLPILLFVVPLFEIIRFGQHWFLLFLSGTDQSGLGISLILIGILLLLVTVRNKEHPQNLSLQFLGKYIGIHHALLLLSLGTMVLFIRYGLQVLAPLPFEAFLLIGAWYGLVFACVALYQPHIDHRKGFRLLMSLLPGVTPFFLGFTAYWLLAQSLLLLAFHLSFFGYQFIACSAFACLIYAVLYLSQFSVRMFHQRESVIKQEEMRVERNHWPVYCLAMILLCSGWLSKLWISGFSAVSGLEDEALVKNISDSLLPSFWQIKSPFTLSSISSVLLLIAFVCFVIVCWVIWETRTHNVSVKWVDQMEVSSPQVETGEQEVDFVKSKWQWFRFSYTVKSRWKWMTLFWKPSVHVFLGYIFITLLILLLVSRG